MRVFKTIISYILVFATLVSCVVLPSYAAEEEAMSFWEWAACATSPAYAFYKWAMGADPEEEDDTWHSGGSSRGGGAGRRGYEVRQTELPSNGYSSDGSILWYPTLDDLHGTSVTFFEWRTFYSSRTTCSTPLPFSSCAGTYLSFSRYGSRVVLVKNLNDTKIASSFGVYEMFFVAPVSGSYSRLASEAAYARSVLSDGTGAVFHHDYSASSFSHYEKGFGVKSASSYSSASSSTIVSLYGLIYLPVFKVILDSSLGVDPSDYTTIYNINTRPTYNNIFNETTNIYTNPTTGEQKTVNNWNYDYTTRTYDLSLLDGMTVKLEFGDINIKLGETSVNDDGDTITNNYTYNYTINNNNPSPSPSKSPSPTTPPSVSVLSRVFQNYGHKITQHYGNEGHNGVDVIPTSGKADTVIAHSEGTVVTVQTGQENDTSATGAASWGNYVKIEHPNGYYTLYAHLASVDVEEGETVYKGQPLGLMGNTGRSFGAHLHFEVYEAETTRINPEPYLNADLPGLETSSDGWTWWKGAWTDFRQWFSGAIGGGKTETIFTPGVDSGGEGEEDDEWSFLDLLKAVVDGVWNFIKGVPRAIFGSFSGLINGFSSIGDFFVFYTGDSSSDGGPTPSSPSTTGSVPPATSTPVPSASGNSDGDVTFETYTGGAFGILDYAGDDLWE